MIGSIAVDAAAVAASGVVLARFVSERRVDRDRRKPPFCGYCGMSEHAPPEERRERCPRSPNTGHLWKGSAHLSAH
jgi:hypothetical protein